MDTRETDAKLREAFRSAAPAVDSGAFCDNLEAKLASARSKHRPSRTLRLVVTACAAVLLVAGVSVGVLEATWHLGRHSTILVITDSSTSETSTSTSSSTTTSLAPATFDFQGLWAGNVQTVPQHPSSLPAEFYVGAEEPGPVGNGKAPVDLRRRAHPRRSWSRRSRTLRAQPRPSSSSIPPSAWPSCLMCR